MTYCTRTRWMSFCQAATAVAFTALLVSGAQVQAEGEEDPFPGPSPGSDAATQPVPEDVPTKANTQTHPAPATRAAAMPAFPATRQPQGAMTGRIMYTSGGHGWQWNTDVTPNRWTTDRGNNFQVVEDFGNVDQMTQFAYQAFNAGATVVPYRPIGNQVNEVVLDNGSAGVTWFGTWSDNVSKSGVYYGTTADAVCYKFTPCAAVETAVARYTPNIPQAGFYPVYAWVLDSSNRAIDQLYRVSHTGGISEVRVNHRRVGKGWVYLGSYYFQAGSSGYAEISNQSSSPAGSNAVADAIRFGNGMGNYLPSGGTTSGKPREEECAMYWVRAMNGVNAPGSNWTNGNVGAPPRMSAYMNNELDGAKTSRLLISFHSNAGGGRGADGLYNDPVQRPGTNTTNQYRLAVLLGREVNQDMYAIGSPPLESSWSVPPNEAGNAWNHPSYAFGELNALTNRNEMDATIIEVAYHDNEPDAKIMRDPMGRIWIARATLQGAIRYFNEFDGLSPIVFPPDTPTHVRTAAQPDGAVSVMWNAPTVTSYGGGAATGYVVYRSQDGYGFGNPTATSSLQTVLSGLPANQVTYLRVAATNAGGESLPSEVIAVRPSGNAASRVLIVNAFDRFDRTLNPLETGVALATYERVKPWRSNNFDYVVQHARALHSANVSFDSSSNEALTQGVVNGYQAVVWAAGEESTADDTFSASEQTMITNFLGAGKSLFVSGAEIGWDLDQSNNGRTFFRTWLGASYGSDDANSYSLGAGTGIFAGIPASSFAPPSSTNNTNYPPLGFAPYDADYCDTLIPGPGATAIMNYSTGGVAAVLSPAGAGKVINMGVPFECISNEGVRNGMMQAAMNNFAVSSSLVQDWQFY